MLRSFLAALVVLSLASGSHALSLTIEIDDPEGENHPEDPIFGSVITITVTLDTTDAPAGSIVDVTLGWDANFAAALNATLVFSLGTSSQVITSGVNVGASNLTSGGGGIPWIGPAETGCALAGPTAGNTCSVLNQTQLAGAVPDPAILVGTLELERIGYDSESNSPDVGIHVVTANAFGATPVFVPEPTTGALVALGVAGLAAAQRRRRY